MTGYGSVYKPSSDFTLKNPSSETYFCIKDGDLLSMSESKFHWTVLQQKTFWRWLVNEAETSHLENL
jgi:hypothetical protein